MSTATRQDVERDPQCRRAFLLQHITTNWEIERSDEKSAIPLDLQPEGGPTEWPLPLLEALFVLSSMTKGQIHRAHALSRTYYWERMRIENGGKSDKPLDAADIWKAQETVSRLNKGQAALNSSPSSTEDEDQMEIDDEDLTPESSPPHTEENGNTTEKETTEKAHTDSEQSSSVDEEMNGEASLSRPTIVAPYVPIQKSLEPKAGQTASRHLKTSSALTLPPINFLIKEVDARKAYARKCYDTRMKDVGHRTKKDYTKDHELQLLQFELAEVEAAAAFRIARLKLRIVKLARELEGKEHGEG